jgi:hypothetical protein
MTLPQVPSRAGSAVPGALMFIAGLALIYWSLSGWGLFGLGNDTGPKALKGPYPKEPDPSDNGTGPRVFGGSF